MGLWMSMIIDMKCDFVVYGVCIVMLEGDFENGGVVVCDGCLVFVGVDVELQFWCVLVMEVVDVSGKFVVFGFVNMYCYVVDLFFWGFVENFFFEVWFEKVWIVELVIFILEMMVFGVQFGFVENLFVGVMLVFDMFWFFDFGVEVVCQFGMCIVIGGFFFDGVGIDGKEQVICIQEVWSFCEIWQDELFVMLLFNLYVIYMVGFEMFIEVVKFVEEIGVLIIVYVVEICQEQSMVYEWFDVMVLQYFDVVGMFGLLMILVYCVYFELGDLKLI